MKLLKVFNRDYTLVKNIKDFDFSKIEENKINKITGVLGNPKEYTNKILQVWNDNKPLFGGILKKYTYNKNTGRAELFLYPLNIDLKRGFMQDPNISDPLGNKIYYISGKIEEVLAEIINQYRAATTDPILYLGDLAETNKNVRFTFKYSSYFEALYFLQKKMLKKGFYIKIGIDGKVDLVNYTNVVNLKFGEQVKDIIFTEGQEENIKTIIFDNKKVGNDHILKEYNNPEVTEGAVKYLTDTRFKDEESVDNYIAKYFEDYSTKIEVKNIITTVDVPLYSKVNIYNWEKTFTELYVVGREYLKNGQYNLKLGTEIKYNYGEKDQTEIVNEAIDNLNENMGDLVPEYIKETYIDSTEIRSPLFKGNDGLFYGVVKVGVDGIIIDGADKSIRSKNYNLSNKTGFKFKDDGTFLLGANTNNYLQYDGTNFKFAGNLQAGSGSSINWEFIENAPTDDWENPSYIKSTKITSTTIESPNISSNYGKITGVLKVGNDGIIIDGINKIIKSSNYDSSNGWQIENNGNATFNNGTFRGVINATGGTFSGNIISSATISGGTFRTNSGNEEVKITGGAVNFYYDGLYLAKFRPGGFLGLSGITCEGDFGITGDFAGTLTLGTLYSSDLVLEDTNNRIKSQGGEIFYDGSNWKIKDSDGRRTL